MVLSFWSFSWTSSVFPNKKIYFTFFCTTFQYPKKISENRSRFPSCRDNWCDAWEVEKQKESKRILSSWKWSFGCNRQMYFYVIVLYGQSLLNFIRLRNQLSLSKFPMKFSVFAVDNDWSTAKTRAIGEICLKLTIKTPELCHWLRFDVFILNFEYKSRF